MDCHTGVKDLVHDSPLPPPDCTRCHAKEASEYATSIHGVSHLLGASGAANCWDCHGSHDILPVTDPTSPVFKMNLPFTCAKCHSSPGLIVAPSCDDCHGVHDIKRAVNRDSPINHANVAKTCGKCHFGVEQTYDQSIHGQLLAGLRHGFVRSSKSSILLTRFLHATRLNYHCFQIAPLKNLQRQSAAKINSTPHLRFLSPFEAERMATFCKDQNTGSNWQDW